MTAVCWFMFLFIILKIGCADRLIGNTSLRKFVPRIMVGYKFSEGNDVLKLKIPIENEKGQKNFDLKFCEISGLSLSNWIIDKANMKYAIFTDSEFDSVRFYNCKFDEIRIERCSFNNSLFIANGKKNSGLYFKSNTGNNVKINGEKFNDSHFISNVFNNFILANITLENTEITNNDFVKMKVDESIKITGSQVQGNNILFSEIPNITFYASLSQSNNLLASKIALSEENTGSMFISCKSLACEIYFDIGTPCIYSNVLQSSVETIFYPADKEFELPESIERIRMKLGIDYSLQYKAHVSEPTKVTGFLGTKNIIRFKECLDSNKELKTSNKDKVYEWIELFTMSYTK
ncbi:MAG: hypothetical protein V2A67_07270 [Bacteroidota bacterium]